MSAAIHARAARYGQNRIPPGCLGRVRLYASET